MNGNKFKRLSKGAEIVMDDKDYMVLGTDNLGRIEMQRIGYYIDDLKMRDFNYNSFDECMEVLQEMRAAYVDCDLTSQDIHERTFGNKFWMHYKDIDEDDIIYSYEK